MIDRIQLRNFKSAEDLDVRLCPLTVLAGLNGSGKSTVIQAFCVARQSLTDRLRFRGQVIQLGSLTEVRTEGASDDDVSVVIEESGAKYRWSANDSLHLEPPEGAGQHDALPTMFRDGMFQLLPADRLVPRNSFLSSFNTSDDIGFLGSHGEFAIDFLRRDAIGPQGAIYVSEGRCFTSPPIGTDEGLMAKVAPTKKLVDQVSAWLQHLSPGVRVSADELVGTDDVSLRFSYAGRRGELESDKSIRPGNVGFGLTYCLPIIIACLSAKPGALLLLENPEAHLHPRGQFALGELLARAAADGVQVVVETHSDHLLNGVRIAVKERILESAQVAIHYMTRELSTGFSMMESPQVLMNGRLSDWPRGFFDQWDHAIDKLISE